METPHDEVFRIRIDHADDSVEPPVIAMFPQGMPPAASLDASGGQAGRRRGRKEMEDGSIAKDDSDSGSDSDSDELLKKTMGLGATRVHSSTRGSKKRRVVRLEAENQVLVYRGDAQMGIGERRSKCTYAVAVLDPATKTVTVHPTPHLVTLRQSVKGRIDRAGQQSLDAQVAMASAGMAGRSLETAERLERNRLLTEAFGSAKNQKQLRSIAASRVDHTQVAGAGAVLGQVQRGARSTDPLEQARKRAAKQGRDPKSIVSVEEDAAMGMRRRVFPQFDLEAETPAEAYPLDGLMTAEEQVAMGEYAGRLGKAIQAQVRLAQAGAGAATGGGGGDGEGKGDVLPEDQGVEAFARAVGMHPFTRDYLLELSGTTPDRKTRREQTKLIAFLDGALRVRRGGKALIGRAPALKPKADEDEDEANKQIAPEGGEGVGAAAGGSKAEAEGADADADADADGEVAVPLDAGDPRSVRELRALPEAMGKALLRKFTRRSRDQSSRFKVVWERDAEAVARLDVHVLVGWLHLYNFAIPLGVLPVMAAALSFAPSVLRLRFAQVGTKDAMVEKAGTKSKCLQLVVPLTFPAARMKKSKKR